MNLVLKDASWWEESIDTHYVPIWWKQKGQKCKKLVFEKFQKILKNHKKIPEASTWSQKMRINERNRLVCNMYHISPYVYDFGGKNLFWPPKRGKFLHKIAFFSKLAR